MGVCVRPAWRRLAEAPVSSWTRHLPRCWCWTAGHCLRRSCHIAWVSRFKCAKRLQIPEICYGSSCAECGSMTGFKNKTKINWRSEREKINCSHLATMTHMSVSPHAQGVQLSPCYVVLRCLRNTWIRYRCQKGQVISYISNIASESNCDGRSSNSYCKEVWHS